MKRISLFLLFSIFSNALIAQQHSDQRKLSVSFHYNAELLGLAYFIGYEGVYIENQTVEINSRNVPKKEWYNYGFYIYEKYKKYAASENLNRSFAIAEHLWLDSILYLLVQVDDFPNAHLTPDIEPKYFINFSKKKDVAEAIQNATVFLDGLNSFYKEINFKQYINDTREFYKAALQQVKENLPQNDFIDIMETFYQKKFESYTLVPSLTIPKGMGFGLHVTKNGRTNLLNIFGAFDEQTFQLDNHLDLGFANPQRLRDLSMHEFGHSFVNPVIDSLPQDRINATDSFFVPIKSAMEHQGYNTWKVCLYEHFVRAVEVIVASLLNNTEGSQLLRSNYINDRKFIYLPIILTELENYKNKQVTYNTAVLNSIDKIKNEK